MDTSYNLVAEKCATQMAAYQSLGACASSLPEAYAASSCTRQPPTKPQLRDMAVRVSCRQPSIHNAAHPQCVEKNQNADWPVICRPQSDALASCADAAVPEVAQIRATCAPFIERYSGCLRQHAAQDDAAVERLCAGAIRDVWECSEKILRESRVGKA